MVVVEVTSKEDFESAAKGITIVDFSAEWCGPCHHISPYFKELSDSADYAGLPFIKVDVDKVADVAEKAGIQAMPTFQVWKEGVKLEEFTGAEKVKLKELCEKYK
mmetsp:Transcript_9272/g.21766  ORF Transcript_9272/g.21766 Transcript_9272/m.21766 type:complete len:105 (+) Transcript_9272:75-389(+)|eukprot:CAMPEP_0171099604 /NCGR_PEP_ID=MMETSP0766_2-20121228/52024_1 /TAXON_ID=439317 /ORGANISM="Gambierdiscus australes, Strain CAWD 149" /LENGTH=104 /DNA_ID=CAMNT_0011559261 /DNA_START=68 /DNA_END=382 /DNA_ORIENTATION=+